MGLSLLILLPLSVAFNLDVENPAVYTGPNGSYFGYSVDFYMTDSSVSIIVGAPKANTSQPNIREGGSVFYCPWSLSQSQCSSIEFDTQGKSHQPVDVGGHRRLNSKSFSGYLNMNVNEAVHQGEFKSHQWFGATVRVHEDSVLACAPLYSWRAMEDKPHADTTGSCYMSVNNFTKFVEYAPCRTGQGYCQGGFSADFTQEGKVVLGGPGSYFWQGLAFKIKTLMGSYFGYAVAATDINNDGMTDLLVGAPMFMVRDSDGRLEELGRVYVYMQNGPLDLTPQLPHLTGTHTFGRFGSSITPLGDLNQDGYNDVAISCPFGGENKQGLVLIYNGHAGGLKEKPSQVIAGQWASATPSALPASFGYAIRGGKDLDDNGYPDLIVGAFGANTAVLYRSRPIVNTSATLTVSPTMINPEEKVCTISRGNETLQVSCVNLSFCLSANGKHLPNHLVQLDRLKQQQKGAVRRALFLDSQLPALQRTLTVPNGARVCSDTKIFLRDEKDFRDKLSPIFVALNFSLNLQAAADRYGLRPILNYQTAELIEQKAQILLDCGEDNICVPDLKISVHGDRKEVYMGDDNSLTLTFNAKNDGGGAYEAELYVVLPPEADYSGIARNNESLTQLTCSYETENQTRYLSCDLGNPMKSGTSLWAGLRFTVPRLKDTHKFVQFDLQIPLPVPSLSHFPLSLYLSFYSVSRPDKVFFPPPNWKLTKNVMVEQDVGPSVQHTYELVNNGPSRISHTLLQLKCPLRLQSNRFIYPLEVTAEGPVNCTTHNIVNPLNLKLQQSSTEQPPLRDAAHEHHIEKRETHKGELSQLTNLSCSSVDCWTLTCNVGLLERGTSAILHVRSRIWAETFMENPYKNFILECLASYKVEKMPYAILPKVTPSGAKKVVTPVVWNKPDSTYAVPLWIIILAILAGLLLLALLIYVLYKLGFFKRTPYGTAMEKAQLKPQAASEA
uniref:Integrin, alpha 5 (fibronectin receptor, alpha polypeptide) n=1 Tax=Cyprinus carpio carpio TaxID=630221 RepID=A0A9J8BJQ6_CYPCA